MTFLKIADLDIGSIDAVNYSGRKEKSFLKRVFFRDSFLERILDSNRYFLVGEKGTGKTAYATFLSNEEYKKTSASVTSVNATDYTKFYSLKKSGHLPVSDFVDTWKTILLMLVADHLKSHAKSGLPFTDKFKNVQKAIDSYYSSAFSPEILTAIEFVKDAEASAALMAKYVNVKYLEKEHSKVTGGGFQTSLLFVENQFKDAISSMRLEKDHIVFIDGIDVRPKNLSFQEYIECIQGLAFAAWSLNVDYFSKIRDSQGRIKIVLLIRPDIFDAVEFQNANAKIRDNSVVLNWITTYKDFPTSRIFRLVDGILSKQEGSVPMAAGEAWKHYFNYDVVNMRIAEKFDDPFISFLRYSFYRPRDVISYLKIMQDHIVQHDGDAQHFSDDVFLSCQKDYSDYLLGEVKDHLSFYYSGADFAELVGFFKFLKGKSHFSWTTFKSAYEAFRAFNADKALTLEQLTQGPEEFLQFLYSMNVVGYDEKADHGPGNFVHWCFRDRTTVSLSPKIPAGMDVGKPYSVHPGLARALHLGASD
jgi:hypothetical protein